MNLYLIRHGESEGNVSGKIQGWDDYPLSELGREQVGLVAQSLHDLPIHYIYSSDLTRAYDTAKAIGRVKNCTVHKWDKVREVYLGPLQGLTRSEIYEQYPEAKEKSIITSGVAGTETNDELTKRCEHVVNQMLLAHRNDHVAIVSHGGFISVFLMYLLTGSQWHSFHRPFQIHNTGITHIEWSKDDSKPIIHYTNNTSHLSPIQEQKSQKGLL
ncbi:phosphoglycerate mutase [Halalkalibacter wakoensis JCM 9140]|uniref:Phosphoglycerate mutase n=1 Tax=Halalkalibacter wakoensis JCM 9140 TaxID=1236970 RepID=W4Q2Z5_9BACI|nr:histidine phosphatase family protein [Halalkalibacter wakoensis]GAE26362.1 phosphoglycerate mutase [Halalkalibacter wakoensis JCM 9140]